MKQRECRVAWLLDSAHGHQTESTVEGLALGAVFFEDIAEGPERHHVDQAIALADVVGERGANVGRVAGVKQPKRGDIPFRPEEGQSRTRGSGDLIVNLANCGTDSVVHWHIGWDVRIDSEQIFHGIVGVSVAGDEINGDILLSNMAEKRVDPMSRRSGRATDSQTRADGFESSRGVIVEIEVRGFFRVAGPEADVGLVPDFEVPLGDLIEPVTADEMLGQRADQVVPFLIALGWRDDGVVPEGMNVLAKGQLFRHEADFDEWADIVTEESVVYLVYIRKVVDRAALRVFVVDADFVVQDVVEADVTEIGDLLYFTQIVSIALSQGEDGAPRAEGLFPKMWEGLSGSSSIDCDVYILRKGRESHSQQRGHNNCCEVFDLH